MTTVLPARQPSRRPLSRRVAGAAAGVVVALVVGGTAAWATGETTVELSVDGDVQQVSTRGETVADVLAEAGLPLGEHDLLAPAADTDVQDGDRVSLRRARALTLVVDGVERTAWVTAESVDEALDQLGTVDPDAELSASRSRPIGLEGLTLQVRTPRELTVTHDGASTDVRTTADDVAGALREAGVDLGPQDRVSVALDVEPTDGLAVQVVRISSEVVTETLGVPAGGERRDDPSLLVGTERVLTEGRNGVLLRTTTWALEDGVRTTSTVADAMQTEPLPRVVAVGTKPLPPPPPPPPPPAPRAAPAPAAAPAPTSSASAGGLNWAALAKCESGGRANAVSSNGLYHGLYQFSDATWRRVGGSGSASQASPAEQTARAQALYDRSGRGSWPHCGRLL